MEVGVGHTRHQAAPAAGLAQPEEHERGEAEDDEEELHDLVVNRAGQAADGDVDEHDDRGHGDAGVDVPAEEQPQQRAHGVHADPRREHGHDGEGDRVEGAGLLVEAELQVFGHAARARAVVERHHEDADEHHGRDGADPVEVAGEDAVFRAAGGHPDHFLRAEVGGEEGEAGGPGRHRSAGQEEIRAAGDPPPQQEPQPQHEDDVDGDEEAVDEPEFHVPP